MTKPRFLLSLLFLVGFVFQQRPVFAQEGSRIDDGDKFDKAATIKKIRAALKARESKGFCGVVLIREKNKDLLHAAYGYRDRESEQKMSVEHGFDIGSLVKPITAIAILRLEQDGKLKVSDTIDKYFDNVPDEKKKITIQNLLEHKAGLPDIFGDDYQVVDKKWFLDKVLNCKLVAEIVQKSSIQMPGIRCWLALLKRQLASLTKSMFDQMFSNRPIP